MELKDQEIIEIISVRTEKELEELEGQWYYLLLS